MHVHRTAEQIAADRQRYEEHQRVGLEFSPTTFPTPSARPMPEPAADTVVMTRTVPGGWYTTLRLAKGETLCLAPQGDGSAAALAAWSAADTSERMNLPDTVKLQWTTELKKGRVVILRLCALGHQSLNFLQGSGRCRFIDGLAGLGLLGQPLNLPPQISDCIAQGLKYLCAICNVLLLGLGRHSGSYLSYGALTEQT